MIFRQHVGNPIHIGLSRGAVMLLDRGDEPSKKSPRSPDHCAAGRGGRARQYQFKQGSLVNSDQLQRLQLQATSLASQVLRRLQARLGTLREVFSQRLLVFLRKLGQETSNSGCHFVSSVCVFSGNGASITPIPTPFEAKSRVPTTGQYGEKFEWRQAVYECVSASVYGRIAPGFSR